jgi:sec-independent protein translocase protein TatA
MFENIGRTEIIIVAVVLLILFGPKKLPEFAKGFAEAIKETINAFRGDSKNTEKKTETK